MYAEGTSHLQVAFTVEKKLLDGKTVKFIVYEWWWQLYHFFIRFHHWFSTILKLYWKEFILLEDRILVLSLVAELYSKTRKKIIKKIKKIEISTHHHKNLDLSSSPQLFIITFRRVIVKTSAVCAPAFLDFKYLLYRYYVCKSYRYYVCKYLTS